MSARHDQFPSPADLSPYERATELVGVIQSLSLARDFETISRVVRAAARRLGGADGATIVLREGDQCFYADEDAVSPLWKGQRFPMKLCISGWVIEHGEPAIIGDIYRDDRIPVDVYRPTFVKSLYMVPIRHDRTIGAIGTYWAQEHLPDAAEAELLQALANSTALAMENVAAFAELRRRCHASERDNAVLGMKVAESRSLVAELRRDNFRDPLTGLYNRRGFLALSAKALEIVRRDRRQCTIVFADIDGLKEVNDRHGHGEGDRLIEDSAAVLSSCFRDSDVVGRLGGDEFAVFAIGHEEEAGLHARIAEAIDRRTVDGDRPYRIALSVGSLAVTVDENASIDQLLGEADGRMYARKRSTKGRAEAAVSGK